MTKRITYYDVLKGYAMILIVCSHILSKETNSISVIGNFFLKLINYNHLPILFLVSGYFSYKILSTSLGNVIMNKACRLLLPYFLWTLIAVSAKQLSPLLNGTFSFSSFVFGFGHNLLHAESLWFFLCLFEIFVIGKVLLLLANKNKYLSLIVLVIILLLQNNISILCIDRIPHYLLYFAVGYFLKVKKIELDSYKRFNPLGLICLLLSIGILMLPVNNTWLISILGIICSSLLVIFTVLCIMPLLNSKISNKVLSFIGLYSLDVYCIHMMFISYLPLPNISFVSLPIVDVVYYLLIALLISLLICYMSKYILHKIKIYRLLLLGETE